MALDGLVGFPEDNRVPGTKMQAFFATGKSVAPAAGRSAVCVAPMLSSGTAQTHQMYAVSSENVVSAYAGAGSHGHRFARSYFDENPRGKLFMLFYADTDGTAADGYITLTGTATGAGLLETSIVGVKCNVGIAVGDTPTVLGDKVVASVNGKTYLPVSAANNAGVVTFTAKHTGEAGGDGTIPTIRFRSSAPSDTGVTVTASGAALGLGDGTAGVDGGTSEADLFDAALDIILEQLVYYVAPAVGATADVLAAAKTHIVAKNTAGSSLYSVVMSAYTGTAATARTLATTVNSELMTIVNQANSEHDPAEIAGMFTAIRQREENAALHGAVNFDGVTAVNLKGVYSADDIPTNSDLNDSLTDGVSPVATGPFGPSLTSMITTYSKTNSVDDWRAAPVHRVSTVHNFMNTLFIRYNNQYGSGFFLEPDPLDSNGEIDYSKTPKPGVVTPERVRKLVVNLIKEFEDRLKNVQASKDSVSVDISNNTERLELEVDLDCVNKLSQLAGRVNEKSAG